MKLPPLDELVGATSHETGCCVLSSDAGELTAPVLQRLSAAGMRVAVLALDQPLPQHVLPPGVAQYVPASAAEQDVRGAVEQMRAALRTVDALVYLDRAAGACAPESSEWLRRKQALRGLYLSVSQLQPELARGSAPGNTRKALLTVSRIDGRFGLTKPASDPFGTAVFGLTKSLAQEWPTTFCRALDLADELRPAEAADAIFAELRDPNRNLVQVGFDGITRAELVPGDEVLTSDTAPCPLDSQSVFLVSGGARGVTADCMLELARTRRASFVLVGRSRIDLPEPEWAREQPADALMQRASAHLASTGEKPTPRRTQQLTAAVTAAREVQAFLAQVRATGSAAEYVCCSVTDFITLAPAVRQAEARLGKVTGIIHGAGVLADKLIEKKTASDFDAVFDTKVEGLAALLRCVDPSALRHVALFSSAAGFFGNRGQTDYAMANEALNAWALAFQRAHPACRVVSFNFGPWEGGMVSPGLRSMFEQQGVRLIDRAGGAQAFLDSLEQPADAAPPQLLVGSGMQLTTPIAAAPGRRYKLRRKLELERNPWLADHRIGGRAVLPMVHVANWLAAGCENVYPGYRCWRIEQLRMHKGIVFDDKLPAHFELELEEHQATSDGFEVAARLSAPTATGRTQPYYQARVFVRRGAPDAQPLADFDLRSDPAYANRNPYADGTLFHGPAFQAVQRILNVSDRRLTVECAGRPLAEPELGQFPARLLDPYRADACFQSILIWVRERYAAGSLPVSLESGEMYQVPPSDRPFYVTLDVVESNPTGATTNLYAHDETGLLFGRLLGAHVTISGRLNALFQGSNEAHAAQRRAMH